MGKEILQKYTIFEVKRQLAEMEKQYGKERVTEMLGEGREAEIDREFRIAVAERLEPYWKDIQAYEHGGFWARLVNNGPIEPFARSFRAISTEK